jgi:phospholipase/carboxylesterase
MDLSLEFLIKEPKIIRDKNPLLLLIHGYGSNEKDLFSFANELPETYYIISVRAPFDLQYGSYAWYAINFDTDQNKFSDLNQAKISRDLIVRFIDELIQNYPIDSDEISLVGFSQGSILSYAIGLSYPEKIKKIIAFSGYLNLDMVLPGSDQRNFKNLLVFSSHGTQDQVIPVDWARKTKPLLDQMGISNTYLEYPIGHGISPQNFFDFKKWLISNQ